MRVTLACVPTQGDTRPTDRPRVCRDPPPRDLPRGHATDRRADRPTFCRIQPPCRSTQIVVLALVVPMCFFSNTLTQYIDTAKLERIGMHRCVQLSTSIYIVMVRDDVGCRCAVDRITSTYSSFSNHTLKHARCGFA